MPFSRERLSLSTRVPSSPWPCTYKQVAEAADGSLTAGAKGNLNGAEPKLASTHRAGDKSAAVEMSSPLPSLLSSAPLPLDAHVEPEEEADEAEEADVAEEEIGAAPLALARAEQSTLFQLLR